MRELILFFFGVVIILVMIKVSVVLYAVVHQVAPMLGVTHSQVNWLYWPIVINSWSNLTTAIIKALSD